MASKFNKWIEDWQKLLDKLPNWLILYFFLLAMLFIAAIFIVCITMACTGHYISGAILFIFIVLPSIAFSLSD